MDQERFNSTISQLICEMSLDENFDDEEKRDQENENNDKQSKPENNEQKTKDKEEKNEEMSIESGVPDLENEAKESDTPDEAVELEDSSRPDLKKKNINKFGDLKYKTYTEEFDEIIKAEELESDEELSRLRKILISNYYNLKILFLN